MTRRSLPLVLLLAAWGCSQKATTSALPTPEQVATDGLRFEITEGVIQNAFLQRGPVTVHVAVTSGARPRLLVAFPAGNAGLVTWFADAPAATRFALDGPLTPVERPDGMRGVSGRLTSTAPRLVEKQSVLGSIRTLREVAEGKPQPPATRHEVRPGPPVTLRRETGCKRHLELVLEPERGTRVVVDSGILRLEAAAGQPIAVRFTALQDDPPLTPIGVNQLLRPDQEPGPDGLRDLLALSFLSFEEKLLAGSWRFLTYFGRDTLLSLRLMMPALQPRVIEAGLSSVIERLTADGQVAHEEDIGDFAALRGSADCAPIHDYKMVDDDFLLAPVLAHYFLDTADGKARAAAFFARKTGAGLTYAEATRKNLGYVLERAQPYADRPDATRLIALNAGFDMGEWRDSPEGLGKGRFAWNVNAVLVPAALDAAARLYASPLLSDPAGAERARKLAAAWQDAGSFFQVTIPAQVARDRVGVYAEHEGLEARPAQGAITSAVVFPALALDAAGKPVPIMHSDDGFMLLFRQPPADFLEGAADRILTPFPAGLMTPVGVVVANPSYAADDKLRALFTRGHYHGTVIWSWQQAMLAAGLRRQLERGDLPPPTREKLGRAETALWAVIHATREQKTGELWSWGVMDKKIVVVPFGQARGHVDESNPVQLWSTVYLAVRPPSVAQ
jgi:hypothetical protein